MPREKVTAEERIEAAKACAEGRISQAEAARRLGLHKSTVEEWVDNSSAPYKELMAYYRCAIMRNR